MQCPYCDTEMKVVKFVNQDGDTKLSRHECPKCKLHF